MTKRKPIEERKTKRNVTQSLRRAYQNGELTEEEIARLEAIGFEFEAKSAKRAVVCYETGEVFESAAAAGKSLDVKADNIREAAKNRGVTAGLHWYFADEPKPTLNELGNGAKRAVVCYETGEVFESLTAAARWAGVKMAKKIRGAIGRRGTSGGYHWYYADEPKPDPSEFKKSSCSRPVVCIETGEVFESAVVASSVVGLKNHSGIYRAIAGGGVSGGFHWSYADSLEFSTIRHRKAGRRRAVVCYETGEAFESLTAAAQWAGVKDCLSIAHAARSRGACAGYHWYYADEPKPDPGELKTPAKRAVVCVETGEVFESLAAGARWAGFSKAASIHKAIKSGGIRGGFHWRYATEEEAAALTDPSTTQKA